MNSILLQYGAVTIRYSYIIYLSAFVFIYFISQNKAKKIGISESEWERSFLFLFVGSLIGARIGYILEHLSLFKGRWLEIFTLWHGAYTLWGALLGLLLTAKICIIICRKNSDVYVRSLEIAAFAMPLFLAISQWALFTEGEGWGKVGYGLGAIFYSGSNRFALWLIYFIWYSLTGIRLYFKKSTWNAENFLYMSGSIALINFLITPWKLFIFNYELIIQRVWTSLTLIIVIILLIKKSKINNIH